MVVRVFRGAASVLAVALVVGCEASKSSNPLSPSVAGPIPGVSISAPGLLEPGAGWERTTEQPLTLLIENASTSGPRPLTYRFEIATDADFQSAVFARDNVAPGEGGRTSVTLQDRLEHGRTYYWRARAEDGANKGPFAGGVHFRMFTPVSMEPPVALEPIAGARINTRSPSFRIRNAARSGPAGSVRYQLQVARNDAFTDGVVVVEQSEQPHETTITPTLELGYDRVHFWRVKAFDGNAESHWSAVHGFYTPIEPPRPTPPPAPPQPQTPAPSPSPSPAPGGACNASAPLPIVECERNKYGHMSSSQLVDFLRATARSLNRNGIAGRPFGVLRKGGGHNCNGYSCDVICAGNGGGQRQWDVLGDSDGAQYPVWGEIPHVRVDVCEIQ